MMLITCSASWYDWSFPAQRRRPGDFCMMTAWSDKGEKLTPILWAKKHPKKTACIQIPLWPASVRTRTNAVWIDFMINKNICLWLMHEHCECWWRKWTLFSCSHSFQEEERLLFFLEKNSFLHKNFDCRSRDDLKTSQITEPGMGITAAIN